MEKSHKCIAGLMRLIEIISPENSNLVYMMIYVCI